MYNMLDDCLNDKIKESYSIRSMLQGHSQKRQKMGYLCSIIFAILKTGLRKPKPAIIKALLDTSSEGTILFKGLCKHLCLHDETKQSWTTAAGKFMTNGRCTIQFKLPELSKTKIVEFKVHLTNQNSKYDLIIGQDLLESLGIDISFSNMTIQWDQISIPMKSIDVNEPEFFVIEDLPLIEDATE